ncbi:MAG: sigma-70 family RNA polymerase sigma factor [Candidatus Woesearchaeota archaeon]|nr:sigma-70 family RNA polymerase sigma factor [Candidatus Woesearchaeota archaeon]
MTDAGVHGSKKWNCLQDDSLDYFSKEANKYALLTHEQEKEYGKQMFFYKREIVSILLELPRYEGGLEDRLEKVHDKKKSSARTQIILREPPKDNVIKTKLGTCLETVQKINDYLNDTSRSEHQISAKKENKLALLNEFKYSHKFISDLVATVKKIEQSDNSTDFGREYSKIRKKFNGRYSGQVQRINTLAGQYSDVFNKLFNANLRLVLSVANKYRRRTGMAYIDIIQEGCLGLMNAVDRYDHSRGFKFSTYATHWIMQAITRALCEKTRTIRITVHTIEKLGKYYKARKTLSLTGEEPTIEALSLETGMSTEKLKELTKINTRNPISLDIVNDTEDGEGGTFADYIEDKKAEDPLVYAQKQNLRDRIREILGTLPRTERRIIELRYGLNGPPSTLKEVTGTSFPVSRERIRQIQASAIRRLQHPVRSRKLIGLLDKASADEARQKS